MSCQEYRAVVRGRWPVAMAVAGGRWLGRVAGPWPWQWPVAGGRWPVAGPLAVAVATRPWPWPVAGGRVRGRAVAVAGVAGN